jgi:hypothetical protein
MKKPVFDKTFFHFALAFLLLLAVAFVVFGVIGANLPQ